MFIKLKHKSLHVYQAVRDLAKEIYKVSMLLPAEEKFNMVPQIRRAALSVKLILQKVQPGDQLWNEKDTLKFPEVLWLKYMLL